jgi:hypothetical protein
MLAERESGTLAERLLADTIVKQHADRDQLTIHADNGSSMASKPVAFLLADLGVTKSHSRPHTSNDNPSSEAQFRTLKYRPDFPDRFASLVHARAFCQRFFERPVPGADNRGGPRQPTGRRQRQVRHRSPTHRGPLRSGHRRPLTSAVLRPAAGWPSAGRVGPWRTAVGPASRGPGSPAVCRCAWRQSGPRRSARLPCRPARRAATAAAPGRSHTEAPPSAPAPRSATPPRAAPVPRPRWPAAAEARPQAAGGLGNGSITPTNHEGVSTRQEPAPGHCGNRHSHDVQPLPG